jgi:hypothetical protein
MTLIQGVTNYWCRTLGIHNRDLDQHPQIDDVIILIKFIQEYEREFTPKQRVLAWVMWDWCYVKRRPLTKKYLKALEKTIYMIRHIRNLKASANKRSRQQLKAHYHNTAKR